MRVHSRSRRTILAAAVFAVALGLTTACEDDDSAGAEFMARGDAAAEQEQWKEAIIEYRNALQSTPNDAAAHFALAKAYLRTSQLKQAYWELHETARLDPANVEARLSYGQLSLVARDFDEALAQADGILEVEADHAVALVLRGQALEGLDRDDEAEEAYVRARELKPDEPSHLLILSSYYERNGRREQAEPLLVELTQRDPGFRSHTALGRFLVREPERRGEAEAALEKALELSEPKNRAAAYQNLSGFYFASGRFDEAVTLLGRGVQEVEDKLELIYLLARFYRAHGDEAKADRLVEQATEARPDDPRPQLILSAYRGRKGDLVGALAAAEAALALDPDDRKAKLRRAELLVDMGYREKQVDKIAEGRAIVDAVLARQPSDPSALFVRAKIEMAEEDPQAAMLSLRAAIDGRPDWAQAHFVLGSAMMLTGDHAAARAELARSVELDPALIEARRVLAQVHSMLGEHEHAIEQGHFVLRERPESIPTRILVAQSLVRLGRSEEAVKELAAIPDDQRNADALYAIGRLRAAEGAFEDARELLLSAAAKRPNHPDILRSLLGIERRLDRVDESKARIEQALTAEPGNARLLLLRGLVALIGGDLTGAERDFKAATELAPDDVAAYEQLAYFYQLTGRVEKTLETYEAAVRARPESARLHHFLGVLYELDGRPIRAVEHYEAAIERDDRIGESMNNLAYILAEQGKDLDRALDLAQEAKGLLPESPNAADTLGWVLLKRGIASAAVGYLREAEAGTDPSDQNMGIIRHHLAMAYDANGEADKAISTLERALGALEKQLGTAGKGDKEVSEPSWAGDVRAMLGRLKDSAG